MTFMNAAIRWSCYQQTHGATKPVFAAELGVSGTSSRMLFPASKFMNENGIKIAVTTGTPIRSPGWAVISKPGTVQTDGGSI
jgi:hypothetical protein